MLKRHLRLNTSKTKFLISSQICPLSVGSGAQEVASGYSENGNRPGLGYTNKDPLNLSALSSWSGRALLPQTLYHLCPGHTGKWMTEAVMHIPSCIHDVWFCEFSCNKWFVTKHCCTWLVIYMLIWKLSGNQNNILILKSIITTKVILS